MKIARMFLYLLLIVLSLILVPIFQVYFNLDKIYTVFIPLGFIVVIVIYEISESHRYLIDKYGKDASKVIPHLKNIKELQASVNRLYNGNTTIMEETSKDIVQNNKKAIDTISVKIEKLAEFVNNELRKKEDELQIINIDLKRSNKEKRDIVIGVLDNLNHILDILNNETYDEKGKSIWEKNIKIFKTLIKNYGCQIIEFQPETIIEGKSFEYVKIKDLKSTEGKIKVKKLIHYGLKNNEGIIKLAEITAIPEGSSEDIKENINLAQDSNEKSENNNVEENSVKEQKESSDKEKVEGNKPSGKKNKRKQMEEKNEEGKNE